MMEKENKLMAIFELCSELVSSVAPAILAILCVSSLIFATACSSQGEIAAEEFALSDKGSMEASDILSSFAEVPSTMTEKARAALSKGAEAIGSSEGDGEKESPDPAETAMGTTDTAISNATENAGASGQDALTAAPAAAQRSSEPVWVPDVVTVVDEPEWDEYVYEKVYYSYCSACGFKTEDADEMSHHLEFDHWLRDEYASTGVAPESIIVDTVHHEAVTHTEDHGHWEYR